ncbi:hypothetical protein ACP70R_028776 [Stipagrostis hirtigluma subsp. patula]
MGGCFSSGSGGDEAAAGYGGGEWERRRRVRPSDYDGRYYVGERDVDNKATVFIAKFHSHQSAAADQPQQAPPGAAAS